MLRNSTDPVPLTDWLFFGGILLGIAGSLIYLAISWLLFIFGPPRRNAQRRDRYGRRPS